MLKLLDKGRLTASESARMFESFDEVHEALEVALDTLEPGAATGPDAAVGVALFAAIENMAAAGYPRPLRTVGRTGKVGIPAENICWTA